MKQKLLLLMLFCCTFFVFQSTKAQTLVAGDIAFIGYNTAGTDSFTFIALKNLPAGEIVYFTEEGVNAGGWMNSGESHITWTIPVGGVAIGTKISVVETSANVFTVNGVAGSSFVLSIGSFNLSAGDSMIAYQSTTGIRPTNPIFISGILGDYTFNGMDPITKWNTAAVAIEGVGDTSMLPSGLTNGVDCISLFGSQTGAGFTELTYNKYNGTLTGTASDIRTAINTASNWTNSNTAFTILPSDYPAASVTAGGTITITPTSLSAFTTCSGTASTSQSFTVSGSALTANVSVSVPSGYELSTSAVGPYSSSPLSITPSGGTISSVPVHVRLAATATGTPAGNITLSSTGATNKTIAVTGTVNSAPAITTNPSNSTICSGANTTFTVTATNATSYQWQVDSGSGYTNISNTAPYTGATTATLTITGATSGMNGYSYRVEVTGSCSPVATSTGAGLTVNASPSIATQPSNSTICAGANTTFGVAANNASSYQWQVNQGAGFVDITNVAPYSNATTATLTITGATAGMNGYQYRVRVIGGCTPSVNSNAVTLTISSGPAITAQPSNSTICAGANTTFAATASNATGYQWQINTGSGYVDLTDGAPYSGATTATLTITSATGIMNGYMYRLIASGGCTPNATSSGVTLTVNTAPAITAQPSASTICAGANTTFTVTASSATGYQWQVDQGAGFSNVPATAPYSGTTSATLTITGATAGLNGYIYRAVATGACTPNATSNGAALTINSAPSITTQPSNAVTCAGTDTSFTAAASNATGYQWQVNQGAGFFNIPNIAPYSGATTATLTITGPIAGMNGYVYRVVATGNCTPAATSSARTLTVTGVPTITAQPSNSTICAGANTSFSTTANNATGYQWQVDTGSGYTNLTNGAPYTGVTTATLTITGATIGLNGYSYRVLVTGSCTPDATSNGATLTVNPLPTITALPASTIVCVNSNKTITATVDNATGYQWYVSINGGASYNSITNNAVYSGATTASLTITGAIASMNNYRYQLIATGTCTPAATSNATILTVSNIVSSSFMTTLACNGEPTGAAGVMNPTGGTAPYSYLWNTGATSSSLTNLVAGAYSCTITDANGCTKVYNFNITQPPALVLTQGTVNNVSCNGGSNGSATVIATGGEAGPRTYDWNGTPIGDGTATISGLSAGTYTVTVTDVNGCVKTLDFTITQPDAITATTTKTDVSCNGGTNGTATVTATGGTGTKTYSWAPTGGNAATATGLAPGTYTVTVTDANACSTTATATIGQPIVLSATTTKTDVSCNGGTNGTATAVPVGGTAPYSYSWAPSGGTAATASGLTPGTYTVTVTDANGCFTTATATIGQPIVLSATTTKTDVSCNGGTNGSATAIPAGGTAPYTYSWAPSGGTAATASGLAPGTYTVTVTDNKGCTTTATATVAQPTVLSATTTKVDVSCNGGSNGSATALPAGGTAPYTYSWAPSGGTAATITGRTPGTYTVTVTDAKGCTTTATATIAQPTVLSATTTKVDVSCNGGTNGSATAVPAGGTAPYTYSWAPSGGTATTATGLTPGTYTVTVTDNKGCTTTATATVAQPTVLSATTTKVDVSCNGGTNGTATAVPAGGTAPYTYSWAPSGGTAVTATGLAPGTYTVTVTDNKGCFTTATATVGQPTVLSATTTKVDVSCNGGTNGSATAVPAGGTAPYTYSWAPSGGTAATATGLASGTYTVTVTDNKGCFTTATATVGQPTVLSATTTKVDVSCNGGTNGSATAVPAGGTAPYTYSWAPSGGTAATATGLAPGTYTVTVTDNKGCTTTATATVAQPTVLSATTTKVDVSCNGGTNGSATAVPAGGTAPYTYSWAPSGGTAATATGLAPGTYTVTVTDNKGCTTTATATVAQPTVLSATTTKVDVSCNAGTTGSATAVPAGGTAPYTYSWAPSGGTAATATGLAAGTYTVTVTDNKGCTTTATAIVGQPAALAATTVKTDVACFGGSTGSATVTATGGTGTKTYSWAPSGGTAATATGLAAGTYTVTVTDANGCTTTATAIVGQPAAALAATTVKTDVSCFGGSTGSATVTATGGTGTKTYSWAPSGGTAATATGLAAGTYTVTVTDANACTTTATAVIIQPSTALSATTTKVDAACNGGATGSATVTATGGTAIYTYSWAPSGGTAATATGLAAGTYTVTVTDAKGCTTTATATIGQPAVALSATTTKVDVACNGGATGSASATAVGGTAPYSYSWSNGGGTASTATGLAAGTYTVTVTDAKGCTTTATAVIGQPATALSATTTKVDVLCNGGTTGSATVTAAGGTAPYTYSWAPTGGTAATATGLAAGTYTVTVTDSKGCTTTATAIIAQPDAISGTIAKTDVSCNAGTNGSATVTAAGGVAPYTYSWSPAGGTDATASDLVAGEYTVTITDANGCSGTEEVTITQPLAIVIITNPVNVSIETNEDATYTIDSTNADSFQWQISTNGTDWTNITDGGTNPTYSGATTNTLNVNDIPVSFDGYEYRVLLTNGIDCVTTSTFALLTVNNDIEAVDDDFSVATILEGTGGIAGDVTANDLLNDAPVNDDDITISVVDNGGLAGVTIDATGKLVVPATATQGTYTVTYSICEIADPTNCSSAEAIVVVSPTSGIDKFKAFNVSVYPNPASTEVFVKIPEFASHRNIKVTIYDMNGRIVRESNVTSEIQNIDISNLESGVYNFNIVSDNGTTTKRIVKNK